MKHIVKQVVKPFLESYRTAAHPPSPSTDALLAQVQTLSQQVKALSQQLEDQAEQQFATRDGLFKIRRLRKRHLRPYHMREIRRRCYAVPAGKDVLLCRVLGRYKMYLDASEPGGIVAHLLMEGYREMDLTEWMAEVVQPGMRVIDVGANVGYYTLLMADLCRREGHVDAFEPHPQVCQLLTQSVKVNGFAKRVAIHQKAVSDRPSSDLCLVMPDGETGHAYILPRQQLSDALPRDRHFEDIAAVSLDEAIGTNTRVDVVKIDAEGAEYAIWKGMQGIIRHNPQIRLAVEFSRSRYSGQAGQFLDDILAAGLRLQVLDGDRGPQDATKAEILTPEPDGNETLWTLILSGPAAG